MPRRSPRLVIDARPRCPSSTLAEVRLRGQSVLGRLLAQATVLSAERIPILAQAEDHPRLETLLAGCAADGYVLVTETPATDAVILRTDRLYEPSRLRRVLRQGRDPEAAVIWRIDTPQGLAGAEQELERRQSYQPLGRYWALAPARALARVLAPTRVRPNAVTLAAGVLMLGAAAGVAFAMPGIGVQAALAVVLALALVLDTADGHLARLQGTASEFGRWLDAYLDELADMALHAAIAWAAFVRDGQHGWLMLGMLYAMGKYQFVVATERSGETDENAHHDRVRDATLPTSPRLRGEVGRASGRVRGPGAQGAGPGAGPHPSPLPEGGERGLGGLGTGPGAAPHPSPLPKDEERGQDGAGAVPSGAPRPVRESPAMRPPTLTLPHKGGGDKKMPSLVGRAEETAFRSRLAASIRLVGHADIRWHLWIVLAALGRLDCALAIYALYFPVRALAVAVRKGVRLADARVSVLILAKNEAENLPRCLQTVAWANEVIVVVDRASRDETREIARCGADLVALRTFDDFASQRNAALELASGEWVFAIDADERASPELAAEVRRVISDPRNPHSGFRVPIRSVILGRRFHYSGTQHDRPLRLFRRGAGRWTGAVHETVDLQGKAGLLVNALQHRTIPDMRTFLRKINEYTTLEAIKLEREERRYRATDLALRPFWTFVKLYVGKQGFRDGLEGLAFCALSGFSVAVRHWKHREMVHARRAS